LEDYWDVSGVVQVINAIRAGEISVVELQPETPSPMSLTLRRQTEASMMYEYAPTPSGVYIAVEEALNKAQMIDPAPQQLKQVSERTRLPENETQLHSLLMIEGDLTAGELNVPPEWLETLEQREQAKYIDPGLWIAAEQALEYDAAFVKGDAEIRAHILRRLLRYRGPQALEQVAQRYSLAEEAALEVLGSLCQSGSAVEYQGLYYHAQLFDRAVKETVNMRRKQIKTLPPERYAALLSGRVQRPAPPKEQLEAAIKTLCGVAFPPSWWESILLPKRVGGYRPELLDTLLSQGHLYWRITQDGELCFYLYEDTDWEADISLAGTLLDGREKLVFDTLLKRGASFSHSLSSLLGDGAVQDTLLNLAEKGLVRADSFIPIRQWLSGEQNAQVTARRRVNARVMAANSGRWELIHPLKELSMEQQLERAFDRTVLLCRETAQGLNWDEAVKLLRLWEYTGRVRRGYFIEGLSGMQFIRDSDFLGVMQALEQPSDDIVWLSAVDIMQPFGKYLVHIPDRSFMNLPGNVVAIRAGLPIAVFERQGKTLRVFDGARLSDAIKVFVQDYAGRRVYPALSRLTVKEYPQDAADILHEAGFKREMQDFVLYRGYK
jgi:ATP-dependent Lhr-like helicase